MKKLEKQLSKDSFKFLKELVESGKYSWKDIEEKVKVENKQIVWKGNLNIRWTKVKKVKAKRIGGDLDAFGVEYLEDIEVEEEIGGDLYINGTKIKKIKIKKIEGNLDAYGAKILDDIEVEEVKGYLDIRKTKVKRIKAKKIAGFLDALGVESLEEIEVEEIGGNININRTKIDFQKKILEKIKKGELKVKGKVKGKVKFGWGFIF